MLNFRILAVGIFFCWPSLSNAENKIDFVRLASQIATGDFEVGKTYDPAEFPQPLERVVEDMKTKDLRTVLRSFSYDAKTRTMAFFLFNEFERANYTHVTRLRELRDKYRPRFHEASIQTWLETWKDDFDRKVHSGDTLFAVQWLDDGRIKVLVNLDLTPSIRSMSLGPDEVKILDNGWMRVRGAGLQGSDIDRGALLGDQAWLGDSYSFLNIATGEARALKISIAEGLRDVRTVQALADDLYEVTISDPQTNGPLNMLVQYDPSSDQSRSLGVVRYRVRSESRVVRRVLKMNQDQYLIEFLNFLHGKKPEESWQQSWVYVDPEKQLTFPTVEEFERRMGDHKHVPVHRVFPVLLDPSAGPQSARQLEQISLTVPIQWVGSYEGWEDIQPDLAGILSVGQVLANSEYLLQLGFTEAEIDAMDLSDMDSFSRRLREQEHSGSPFYELRPWKQNEIGIFRLADEALMKTFSFASKTRPAVVIDGNKLVISDPVSGESVTHPIGFLYLKPRATGAQISCITLLAGDNR